MCDDTLKSYGPNSQSSDVSASQDICGSDSPRDLIESVVLLLRNAKPSVLEIDRLLEKLMRSLERCFEARKADDTYESAIIRAPWLSAELDHLNQQCASLRQSLQAMRLFANRCDNSPEATAKMAQQFSDFTELYLEHEAAECNFLQSAYPGPDWAQ